MSPFNYAANNPISLCDPDGGDPQVQFVFFHVIHFPLANSYYNLAYSLMSTKNRDYRTIGNAMTDITAAWQIGEPKSGSLKICDKDLSSIASHFEVNLDRFANFGKVGADGTPGNAFRHVFWQAMVTRDIGYHAAKSTGDFHETTTKVDFKKRTFRHDYDADQTIDLFNNMVGRHLGLQNPNESNIQLANRVIDYFKNVGLWTMEQKGKNTFIINRTKLTKEQYKAAKTN